MSKMVENKQTRKERKKEKRQAIRARKKRERARNKAERKYEKKLSKEGRTSKSRQIEQDRYRQVDKRLNRAIGVVFTLLILVLVLVFFF